MITEYLIQVVILLVAVVTAPVILLARPLFGKIDLTLVGEYGRMFLSWSSIFVDAKILKAMVAFVPLLFGAKAMIGIYRWVIRLVRG